MSAKDQKRDECSPYVSIYLPRTQAEALAKLISEQPQRKWKAVLSNVVDGLNKNSGWRLYLPSASGWIRRLKRNPLKAEKP